MNMEGRFPGNSSTGGLDKNGHPLAASKKQVPAVPSAGSSGRALSAAKPAGMMPATRASTTGLLARMNADNAGSSDMSSRVGRSTVAKSTPNSSAAATPVRRISGGLVGSQSAAKRIGNGTDGPVLGKKVPPTMNTNRLTNSEVRRASAPLAGMRTASAETKKTPQVSDRRATESSRTPSIKPSLSGSSSMKVPVTPSTSSDRGILRRASSGVSSSSIRTPSSSNSSSFKSGSLSSSADKGSAPSSRKKPSTPESRDSRLIILPQVEVKAGDDLRLDLRGQRVRSLTARGLNLSSNLEFVYLRDNLLSSLEGIEILTRVKVLDLSFNNFKGTDFGPLGNCKALQQLYLAGNQITSLSSLPELSNLEFLSVAQNKLKSLCMASQPRLQVLAASKNRISTLKGFPHFPVLEHLRVEENPVLELPHLEAASILLVGPTLKKFNDRDLSSEEMEISKHYPAHTPLCIRDGWELCRPENSVESTFHFLVEKWKDHLPPSYTLKEASIDKPFEGDICHCHFSFSSDHVVNKDSKLILKYQWFIGGTTPTNFIIVDDAVSKFFWPKHEDVGKYLKVECTPVLEGVEYPSVFAVSSPVSAGTGCPKVLNMTVHGKLVEGNIIRGVAEIAWCGGTAGKGVTSWLRRKWNSSPVVITGAEDEEYQLTVDDIDSSLVFMYTPVTQEGSKGEPQYAMTDFVKAAAPSVHSVQILGDAVEGNIIKGVGKYFGGKEGPSQFEWLRENKETGDRLLVSVGSNEYSLTKDDVGWRIAFSYIPINFEGQEGNPVCCVTDIIKRAPPKVKSLKIIGDLREGSKVTVSAVVTGGTEGSSRVQWFKTSSTFFDSDNGLEPLSASKIAKAFRIPVGAVGYYLVAKFIPMAPDGESGVAAYVVSDAIVETLPPSLNFLAVTGDYCEGEMLTASYGYIGGHEGKSLYSWYLHEREIDINASLPKASGSIQYQILKADIGKFITFKCTPVRDDGTVGAPRICTSEETVRPGNPRLTSLRIVGESVEGNTLSADKKYWGGDEGNSVFQWFLIGDDGVPVEIKGATAASYILTIKDIGYKISVSCHPIRCDGARGATVISAETGPVLAGSPTCKTLEFVGSMVEGTHLTFVADYVGGQKGNCTHEWYRVQSNGLKERLSNEDYLDLSLEDVGKCIELVYTPVRKDGFMGSPKSIVSAAIAPAEPMGTELSIPECYEDQQTIPHKSYYGGEEGRGEYVWYRTSKKLEVPILDDISEDAIAVGESLIYTPSLEDVGYYLALRWVPTRADGKSGHPVVAICNSPVSPAPPSVSNVCIRESSFGIYTGEGKYYGGHEGSSLYSWYRETNEGITLITGANSITYEVTDSDYNYRLLFGYTPVRSDSVVGDLCLSDPSSVVLPALPQIEALSFVGKAIEGEILTAKEIMPDNEVQRKVWNNYKREVKFQWFFTKADDAQSFELVPSQHSCSYKLRLEDVGRCLRCDCIMTDVFGRSSNVASAQTSSILPGIPRIDKLEIEGRGFHTNLYAVRGNYSGGIEGKSKIQWLRSMIGSPDLISIPGETGRMYEANVDDVGYRLVALYTPVREDGIEGQPVSVSTEPIAVEPDVYKEVRQKVDLGSVKFEVLCDKDQSQKKQVPGVGNLERRILEVNRKRIKVIKPGSKTSFPTTEIRGTYAPPFHVELFRNDQHRFRVVVDSDDEVDLMVQTRHMRDVIVLVIRGLAQRFNSTSLNSLLQIGT